MQTVGQVRHLRQKLRQQPTADLRNIVMHGDDAVLLKERQAHVEGRQAAKATAPLHVARMIHERPVDDVQHHVLGQFVLSRELRQGLPNLCPGFHG